MHEAAIEEVIWRAPREVLGGLGLEPFDRQVPLMGGGLRVDLLARHSDGRLVAIELKRDELLVRHVKQVLGYVSALRDLEGRDYQPLLMGLRASSATRSYADKEGVSIHLLDPVVLEATRAKLGVTDLGPAGPGDRHRTPLRTRPEIEAYWTRHCTDAAPWSRALTVELTLALLEADPRIAVSLRKEEWTNITWPDGRLVAAINADRDGVKFDFALPASLGDDWLRSNVGTVKGRRSIGIWAQSRRIRERAHLDAALQWWSCALPIWQAREGQPAEHTHEGLPRARAAFPQSDLLEAARQPERPPTSRPATAALARSAGDPTRRADVADYATTVAAWASLLGGTVAMLAPNRRWRDRSLVRIGDTEVPLYVCRDYIEVGSGGKSAVEPLLAPYGLRLEHVGRQSYRVHAPTNLMDYTPV